MIDFLGNPDLLDKTRYQWQKVKVPQECMTFKDNEFTMNIISFYDADPDLYVRFKSSKGRYRFYNEKSEYVYIKQAPIYLIIRNYKELTALEILHDLYSGSEKSYPLGKNFEDGLFIFYQAHNLDLGFVRRRINE